MPNSNQSQTICEMFTTITGKFNGAIVPDTISRHSFSINLAEYDVCRDTVDVKKDDYPYLRAALVYESIRRGDVPPKSKDLSQSVTITVN